MKLNDGQEVKSMVEYLEWVLANGDRGEPEYVDGVNGEGVAVFGRYVYEWTSQGFTSADRHDTRREAVEYAEGWNRDRFAPSNMFETRRVSTVDLEYIGGEGTVEYRNWPTACTVNIYYNGSEVDVFTLHEPVDSLEDFEVECRDHFASSEFVGGE